MAEFTVDPLGAGWYSVSDGVRRWRVAVAGPPDATWVFVDGQVGQVAPPAAAGRRRRSQSGESTVMSPMPATVVTIAAVPGQAVVQGDTLIVLEAMKMELPIRAPRDGVVKAVHCGIGDLVQPGVSLLEFA